MFRHTACILIAFFAFLSVASSQQDGLDKMFPKYLADESNKLVTITGRMITKITENPEKPLEPEVKDILKGLSSMRVLSGNVGGKKLFLDAGNLLKTNGYEEVLSIREKGESVKFFIIQEGKPNGEMIIVSLANDAFTVTSLSGKIDLQKISRLKQVLNIKGAEYIR